MKKSKIENKNIQEQSLDQDHGLDQKALFEQNDFVLDQDTASNQDTAFNQERTIDLNLQIKQKQLGQKQLEQWLTIGELAQRSAVSVPAIRFYEEKELIWSIRTQGNQRRYQRAMLRRIAIIKIAQQVGISLQQVKEAFAVLPKQKVASKSDWKKMSQVWQAQLDQQIMDLLKLRQQLDKCIGCGCLSLKQCPLRNPNDQLGQESAGAHFQDVLMSLLDVKTIND